MATPQRTKASPKKAPPMPAAKSTKKMADAIALLKADHAEVKEMYEEYKAMVEAEAAPAERSELAQAICAALSVHATIEEEIFYPAAREAIDDPTLVAHADVEHESAKDLIAKIESMEPDDDHFDATVCVLCEYVVHHVKEEETELFPAVKAAELDLKELGEQMAARKEELMEEG